MTEVTVDESTKGVLVFAKVADRAKTPYICDVILLIESVKSEVEWGDNTKRPKIYAHACIKSNAQSCIGMGEKPFVYGRLSNYKFYKPTYGQRDLMKYFLESKHYKFVKENNKLVNIPI